MDISEGLLILIACVTTSMLPWAYKVHGRLTAIEIGVKDAKELKVAISILREDMHRMDVRMAKIENGA